MEIFVEFRTETCFNSTLVQLKEMVVKYIHQRSCSFNSTLVQLKEERFPADHFPFPRFNSTLVQLKELFITFIVSTTTSFNSTLVQLKAVSCACP